ncbi:hypothetical protein [Streptomyces sp. NBC_01006]|uniref:hypothetical protein n=1 Tax=Streptomyces sp. NBC_01006 TaxID=2903716 RepID=UPI00386CB43F|nr:hypothetical protein OG509_27820 [Streptomyces sp. NBC_01006]
MPSPARRAVSGVLRWTGVAGPAAGAVAPVRRSGVFRDADGSAEWLGAGPADTGMPDPECSGLSAELRWTGVA